MCYNLSMTENLRTRNTSKNKEKSADEILKAVFQAAEDFGENRKWKDDATVVVIKRIL